MALSTNIKQLGLSFFGLLIDFYIFMKWLATCVRKSIKYVRSHMTMRKTSTTKTIIVRRRREKEDPPPQNNIITKMFFPSQYKAPHISLSYAVHFRQEHLKQTLKIIT